MSRTKKSRKPSAFDINPIVVERKTSASPEPRKPKKKKGKQAGNRQKEALQAKKSKGQANSGKKDPRIGSKKPIELTPSGATQPVSASKRAPVANKKVDDALINMRTVAADDSLQQELYAIEDDAKLQQIIAKQEEESSLTEAEVDYFNEKMDRHQTLSNLLGLSDDEDEDYDPEAHSSEDGDETDEDDMWDKLDSSDLSKFQ